MPTKAERQVFAVLAEEILDIPVRGAPNRRRMEDVSDALAEMSRQRIFEQGTHETMEDVMLSVKLKQAQRSRRKGITG